MGDKDGGFFQFVHMFFGVVTSDKSVLFLSLGGRKLVGGGGYPPTGLFLKFFFSKSFFLLLLTFPFFSFLGLTLVTRFLIESAKVFANVAVHFSYSTFTFGVDFSRGERWVLCFFVQTITWSVLVG